MKNLALPRHEILQKSPTHFLSKIVILFAFFALLQYNLKSQTCSPPTGCGTNPQYFCDEVTLFNWAIIPTGTGQYNIAVFYPFTTSFFPVTYYLMSGSTVVATLSGTTGVFQNINPGCYRIVICVDGDTVDFYCCQELPCAPTPDGCCELKYHFFTNLPNPSWNFDDMTSASGQNVVHEYTNVNTYPSEGISEATITLSWGTNTYYTRLFFPQGIWVGADCIDEGETDILMNSLDPTLKIFPTLNYFDRQISIKGSITMNEDYQFTNCEFCMHPGSRIVAETNTLSFLSGTILHEADCRDEAWFGVEIHEGAIVGSSAEFTGAYNAMFVPSGLSTIPAYSFENCFFNRNYLGINIASPVVLKSFGGNTFGLSSGIEPWPGIGSAGACSWVTKINKPLNTRPFAGIFARTPGGSPLVSVNISINNPSSLSPNVFINLSNGIYLYDANANINRCRFQNMLTGGYLDDDGVGISYYFNTFTTRSVRQQGLGKGSSTLTFDNCLYAFRGYHGNLQFYSFNNNMNVANGYKLTNGLFQSNSFILTNTIQYNADFGIYLINTNPASRMQIRANRIVDANSQGTGVYAGTSLPPSTPTNYAISILGNNNSGSNNGIYDAGDGIEIYNHSNILVENNTISNFTRYGLVNVYTQEVDIRCNNISSTSGEEAIRSNNTPNTLIEYNQTDDSDMGISINGPGANTTIQCNTIGSHDIGLNYDGAGITGPQRQDGTSAGNIWNGTYSSWAASAQIGTYQQSLYFYRNGEINPNEVTPSFFPLWFTLTQNGITCQPGCPTNQYYGRAVTGLDIDIATDSLNLGGLTGYLLKRSLFKDLVYDSSLYQGNLTLQNFYSTYSTTNGGQIVLVEKALADGHAIAPGLQTQWSSAITALDTTFENLYILDSLVQDSAATLASQLGVRQTFLQSTVVNDSIITAIYAGNLNARIASTTALQLALDSIAPATQWETNEKRLNEIYLHTTFVDQLPDSAEVADILDIAEQCSADGGPVVFRARVWYHELTGINLDVLCDSVSDRSRQEELSLQSTEQNLRITPNPAQNEIKVWLPSSTEGGILEIFSMLGKLEKTIPMPTDAVESDFVTISTTSLSNGIYFCRLSNRTKTVESVKFIIQR